jgi:hypothetical protein
MEQRLQVRIENNAPKVYSMLLSGKMQLVEMLSHCVSV